MDLPLMLLLVGLLFLVVFQGMSFMRREGFSMQFILEILTLTLLAAGLAWLHILTLDPLVLLLILYLVGMRTRLLVDLGNLFARQGRFDQAEKWYLAANRAWPDPPGREIVALNQSASLLFQGKLDQAAAALQNVLARSKSEGLGDKFIAAAHYNLGVVYRKQGNEALARSEFNIVVELLPISEFGRLARAALAKNKGSSPS
jgi:tetratricopeptide (TPR) repeat protein